MTRPDWQRARQSFCPVVNVAHPVEVKNRKIRLKTMCLNINPHRRSNHRAPATEDETQEEEEVHYRGPMQIIEAFKSSAEPVEEVIQDTVKLVLLSALAVQITLLELFSGVVLHDGFSPNPVRAKTA